MLHYIEAPSLERPKFPSVFLGGGITNCPDWQAEVLAYLRSLNKKMTVYNPRRAHFPIDDPAQGRIQVEWEFARLHWSDVAAFWFSRGSINPIVLFELGAALERNQRVVVGIDPQYERVFDVEIQTELMRPDLPIARDLRTFAQHIGKALLLA